MSWWNRLAGSLWRRGSVDERIREEMEFHAEMRARERMRNDGLSEEDAHREARRSIGAVTRHVEEARDADRIEWLEALLRESRQAVRSLARRKGPTFTALATLALGIGLNTAIFSLLDAVAFKPLPFGDPGRVAAIRETRDGQRANGNPQRLRDWSKQVPSFAAVSGLYQEGPVLTGHGDPRRLEIVRTFGDFCATAGLDVRLGRAFTERENAGLDRAVILNGVLHRELFGGRPDVLGQALRLDGQLYNIVGVAEFPRFPNRIDGWIPASPELQGGSRRASFLFTFARLRPGASWEQAQAELSAVEKRFAEVHPDTDRGLAAVIEPMRDYVIGDVKLAALALQGVVGFVLLIACVNLAGLLLGRAAERQRESAIRTALGAGAWSLMRLYLLEHLLLALAGGGIGLGLAHWSLDWLVRLLPVETPLTETARIDWRVALFGLAVSVLCGLVVGLGPAWTSANPIAAGGVGLAPRMARSARRGWLRPALVVAETAAALTLLVGAGTLLDSFVRLRERPLGFQPEQLVTARVAQAWTTPKQRLDSFYATALERFAAIPGVRSAALVDRLPFGGGTQTRPVTIPGRELDPVLAKEMVGFRGISGPYFETLGIPLLAGETVRRRGSAVVNATFARRYFGAESPVGRRVAMQDVERSFEIVGVAADVRREALEEGPGAEVFVLMEEVYWPLGHFVLRSDLPPASLAAALRQEVARLDANLIVDEVQPMAAGVDAAAAAPRRYALLVGAFAAVALLLAMIGLNGMVASDVASRRQEIGIRMALGAEPRLVIRELAGRGALQVAVGCVLGLAGGAAIGRLLTLLPVGAKPFSLEAFAGAVVVLAGTGIVSCWLAAREAALVDPVRALRHE